VTTEEFCAAEGISKPSFYAWRRKLGLSKPQPRKLSQKKSFQQLVVTSTPVALIASLPGGIQLEVSTAHENSLRTVVSELVRASRAIESESAPC